MCFLFGEVSSSSGCLGWATLFDCGTPRAFHIIILLRNMVKIMLNDTLYNYLFKNKKLLSFQCEHLLHVIKM